MNRFCRFFLFAFALLYVAALYFDRHCAARQPPTVVFASEQDIALQTFAVGADSIVHLNHCFSPKMCINTLLT